MPTPYLVALSHFQKIGPVGYKKLLTFCGDANGIWHAARADLLAAEIHPETVDAFLTWRQRTNPQQLFESVLARGISLVALHDNEYPTLLKEIHDPPFLLYYKGHLPPTDAVGIAVVGTRTPTDYGRTAAREIASDLTRAGAIVVSGMAQGIDQEAHTGALEHQGRTIAILGSGLSGIDSGYKATMSQEIIAQGGAVISEFPPDAGAGKWTFIVRNRIIAGICKGTVVVEADMGSGSLITADAAKNENRDVFAVPGSIYEEKAKGTHHLLRQGARLVTCAKDILDDLETELVPNPIRPFVLNAEQESIYQLLSKTPQHVDDIARQAGIPTAVVTSSLTIMELQGAVRNLGGMRYIR